MKKLIVFLLSMCGFAFVAWVGGYDFDERNFWAAWFLVVSIFFSVIIAHLVPWSN